MRRSLLLQVSVYCPHFQRPVQATRNVAVDEGRLVSCSDGDRCRELPGGEPQAPGLHERPYPAGCPVYPTLARS